MIEARVEPIQLEAAISSWLGPQMRAGLLAEEARLVFAETDARNAAALGQAIPARTIVDGIVGAAIARVKPDGIGVRAYDFLPVLFVQIGELLRKHSPVRTGRYQRSHTLFADDEEIATVTAGWKLPALPEGVREFYFAPIVPYGRMLEEGWSKQAPDGVYQVVATMAQVAFGRFATIGFGYREIFGLEESRRERHARPFSPRDMRQPVIVIQPS